MKLNYFLPTLLFFSISSFASTDLRSTVPGISIENTHLLFEGKNGSKVLRGSEPKNKVSELIDYGITDVIIFKNQTKSEVDTEIKNLLNAGIQESQIHHIPFLWKDIKNQTQACEQIIEAIQIIKNTISRKNRSVFFHCTVGQDRTGVLAGIFNMLQYNISLKETFEHELCGRGYEAGNSSKPANVVGIIRKNLTPVFLKLAYAIETQGLTLKTITPKVCKSAMKSPNFSTLSVEDTEAFICR